MIERSWITETAGSATQRAHSHRVFSLAHQLSDVARPRETRASLTLWIVHGVTVGVWGAAARTAHPHLHAPRPGSRLQHLRTPVAVPALPPLASC